VLLAVLYFPVSGSRPILPVPSPAAISLLLTLLVTAPGPLVGPARPTCNYPFPIPTQTKLYSDSLKKSSLHSHTYPLFPFLEHDLHVTIRFRFRQVMGPPPSCTREKRV
jgi:hypothetical protein